MKKTILFGKRYHLLFLLVMLLSGSVVHAEDKPFKIYDADDWVSFVNTVRGSYSSRNAVLMANINLGNEYDDKYIVGIMNPYLGEFDGNGYSISFEWTVKKNLNNTHTALFAYLKDATIKNVHIKGTLKVEGGNGAGLVLKASGNTVISNCSSELNITADEHVAGLVHNVDGSLTVNNCLVGSQLQSTNNYVNGFVCEYTDTSTIKFNNCLFAARNNGDSNHYTFAKKATIKNCYYYNKCGKSQGIGVGAEDLVNLGVLTLLNQGDGNWAQVVYGLCPEPYTPARENVKNYVYKGNKTYYDSYPRWTPTQYNCHNFYFDESKDWNFVGIPCFHCDTVASSRIIPDQVYSTVCLPWAFTTAYGTNCYYFKRLDKANNELVFGTTSVANDPYNPYMIYGLKGVTNNMQTINTYVYTEWKESDLMEIGNPDWPSVVVEDKGIFRGTLTMISNEDAARDHLMVLQGGGKWKYISASKPTSYVPAWRCYFKFDDETVQSKDFSIAIEDETTGTTVISKEKLDMSNSDAPAYNLAGQKVSGDYKGIIIKNGKKTKKF